MPLFRILGYLELEGSADDAFDSVLTRACATTLLLFANRLVSQHMLIDFLWDRPPASAKENLRNHVAVLRRVLESTDPHLGKRITTRRGGPSSCGAYRLTALPGELDLHLFTEHCRRAHELRRTGDDANAVLELRQALRLWRGRPGEGLATTQALDARLELLHEQYLNAVEEYLHTRFALGETVSLLEELRALTVEHPLRERLTELLMRVLYHAGDPAGALTAFQRHRVLLGEELGVDPSPRMNTVYLQIIRHDEAVLTYARVG